jgi:type I restriction-modification system DNA methylase subunit
LACDLRHICGRNFDWLDQVIPCYDGFPIEEKRAKIKSALSSEFNGFPVRLRNVLNALRPTPDPSRDGGEQIAWTMATLEEFLQEQKAAAKQLVTDAPRKDKKRIEAEQNALIADIEDTLEIARQREWLVSKFGEDGRYKDVLGLCKIATIQEIAEKNYSLTPGAYVGVAEQEDDGVDFHERMNEIHAELAQLNQEANVLMDEIQKAWEGLK